LIIGSGNPTPYDLHALVVLCGLALVLLVGAIFGSSWSSGMATLVRWGTVIAAVLIMGAVFLLTPSTSGIIGAARLLTLWPALAACIVFFLIWTWRSGRV
jgi:hypothetical protein